MIFLLKNLKFLRIYLILLIYCSNLANRLTPKSLNFMSFKTVIHWISSNWKTISAIIASILALAAGAAVVTSCGSSVKAMVTTPKDSSVTHISISTSNPTEITPSTTTNPNIEVK